MIYSAYYALNAASSAGVSTEKPDLVIDVKDVNADFAISTLSILSIRATILAFMATKSSLLTLPSLMRLVTSSQSYYFLAGVSTTLPSMSALNAVIKASNYTYVRRQSVPAKPD